MSDLLRTIRDEGSVLGAPTSPKYVGIIEKNFSPKVGTTVGGQNPA